MSGAARAAGMIGPAVAAALLASCQPYRVEYHKRPAYYEKALGEKLPDEVVLADGTRIVYERSGQAGAWKDEEAEGSKVFQVREESDDGTVTLQAMMPEHVIANTITCLRNEEYELLWDQMLARETKDQYEAAGMGVEEFASFFRDNRRDLLETLMRMMVGMVHQDVVVENAGPGVIRCRLRRRVAANFRFTTVDVVAEGFGMRLLMIR